MSEVTKASIKAEIAALSRLKDEGIDTSALPEIRDWSQSVQGRFCRSLNKRVMVVSGDDTESSFSQVVAGTDGVTAGYSEIGHVQLFEQMSKNSVKARTEFVRRFGELIASSVMRATRKFCQYPEKSLVNDLIQDVYLKLFKQGCRALKSFHSRNENAVYGFLSIAAQNTVYDYFRHRPFSGAGADLDLEALASARRAIVAEPELQAVLAEFDRVLQEQTSLEERQIFHLYYRYGYSKREISRLYEGRITERKIEVILSRLVRLLRTFSKNNRNQ